MFSYPRFPDHLQEEAIEKTRRYLGDKAELAMLAYTGGRAFGWGVDRHDIDLRGFFVPTGDNWWTTAHFGQPPFDCKVRNIHSFDDPEIRYWRWKLYYDRSNPIYVNDRFDYFHDFMDHLTAENVETDWPVNIDNQISRMKNDYATRNILHTYKELLIPIYYLDTGIIETDMNAIMEEGGYDLEGLPQAIDYYSERPVTKAPPQVTVYTEINELYEYLSGWMNRLGDYHAYRPPHMRSEHTSS